MSMGPGNGEMHQQSSAIRLPQRPLLNRVSLFLFQTYFIVLLFIDLLSFWDSLDVFKWHHIAKCRQPQINTLTWRGFKRRLKGKKLKSFFEKENWSLIPQFFPHILTQEIFPKQFCREESAYTNTLQWSTSVDMVRAAKVTQGIQ